MRFHQISSGRKFAILNTHLDDQSDEQRRLAASMLLVRAKYEAINTGTVFVIGDFNRYANYKSSYVFLYSNFF